MTTVKIIPMDICDATIVGTVCQVVRSGRDFTVITLGVPKGPSMNLKLQVLITGLRVMPFVFRRDL